VSDRSTDSDLNHMFNLLIPRQALARFQHHDEDLGFDDAAAEKSGLSKRKSRSNGESYGRFGSRHSRRVIALILTHDAYTMFCPAMLANFNPS
jgi:hypothetical protein